jgi:hypothetical protein
MFCKNLFYCLINTYNNTYIIKTDEMKYERLISFDDLWLSENNASKTVYHDFSKYVIL